VAIAEGRHIDVIEMDAASHTGVDDVREIIEAVRYAAVSARYKIYIIDEVHMLSRNAFNALLKTLEEPPPHVKFLFATTEVDKLPVTVLSRCQRFDLRRIQTPVLAAHFGKVCGGKRRGRGRGAGDDRGGGGRFGARRALDPRPGDQPCGHGGWRYGHRRAGPRDAGPCRQDHAAPPVRRGGSAARAMPVLEEVASQFALRIEPAAMMRAQLDLVHKVTVAQISGAADAAFRRGTRGAGGLGQTAGRGRAAPALAVLLKGYEEVRGAPDPLVARADGAAARDARSGSARSWRADQATRGLCRQSACRADGSACGWFVRSGRRRAAKCRPGRSPDRRQWAQLVEQVEQVSPLIGSAMRPSVRVVSLAPGHRSMRWRRAFRRSERGHAAQRLEGATGGHWQVERSTDLANAMPSLEEARAAAAAREDAALREDPLVRAAFAAFPGAEMIDESTISAGTHKSSSRRA